MPQTPSHRSTDERLRTFAKRMRHAPTDAEAKMWRLLRDRRLSHLKFRRQVPFRNYILDFACFEKRLVIEIDGGQHASSQGDAARTDALAAEGFQVLRYWNNDVLRTPEAVLEDIIAKLAEL
ncbi:endonuclease domain-containing protein [Bradyrhizobium sp. CCBAU 53421]|uniref:endonuclease domain-containing protein n=1 Tax=Bradyrhizobium sp. CCBAU 53421 TaxID=1325120 RepID=UPI00188D2F0D|nr:endonuclease domain-containing protein [Bradyrhizobium sp. CCBAU 53421]QOZ37517.1 endonuclease domain-containing protein [Bradyrhizobium sp. CCBAU 53421]